MNILISNDDGIFRQGIAELAKGLLQLPGVKLYVFAPDSERTAASMCLTVRDPLKMEAYDKTVFGAEEAWAVSGTPADCVRLGLDDLRDRGIPVDLVCTGINHGWNIGGDTFFSGTVGAAAQAVLKGTPAIAFSLGDHQCSHFEHFSWVIPEVVKKSLGKIPPLTLVNVNVPDAPEEAIKGIKVCPVGRRFEDTRYNTISGGGRMIEFFDITPPPGTDPDQDTLHAKEGWITVSPIVMKRSPAEAVEHLKGFGISMPRR